MKELVLLFDEKSSFQPDANQRIARWEGREAGEGEYSLTLLLDEKVEEIRASHMQWAYQTGLEFAERLGGGTEPSMWWTSLVYERHPRLSPLLYPLYKSRVLELLMLEEKFDCLHVIGAPLILEGMFGDLCERRGWKFRKEGGKRVPLIERTGLERIYYRIPALARAMARFCIWFWKIRRKLPYAGNTADLGGKSSPYPAAAIVTYFPNIDLQAAGEGQFISRYWESLQEALNRQARHEKPGGPHFVNWLFIRFPSPELSFQQCLALRDLFQKHGRDGRSFHYLEEFLSARDLLKALWRFAAIAFQSLLEDRKFRKSCVFAGSSLDFRVLEREQWAESFRGWRCLERCLQDQAFKRYFKLAEKQRWVLYPLENCPWERMLVEASRKAAASPIYGAQHTIIRPTDFRYFDAPATFTNPECAAFQPDRLCVNGDNGATQLLENGLPPERLARVEALRYLYLKPESLPVESPELPPQAGEPLFDSTKPRLLVLTSFFKEETAFHLSLLGQALDAGLFDGWLITIKPHPCLSVEEWVDTRPDKGRFRIAHGPISLELVPGVKVWASNSTTAALEAILKHLPVMVMRPCNDFDLCPVQNIPGLIRTGTLADVKKALPELAPLPLPEGYLDLEPDLHGWKKLLGLNYGN